MSYDNWREPWRILRQRAGPATAEQRKLAEYLGVPLPRRVRHLVAAALLQDALSGVLGKGSTQPPSVGQLDYLHDLAPYRKSDDGSPKSAAVVSALIDLCLARRAAEALNAFKPARGDIAFEWARHLDLRSDVDYDPARLRIISSIGADGRVYFEGGGNRRTPAHLIEIVYRAQNRSVAATEARRIAEREAAAQRATVGPHGTLSMAKGRQLRIWQVNEYHSIDDRRLDELRGVIETAVDEKPIQLYLQEHPEFLAALLGRGHGRWVRPQVRFGNRYVADFLIADADSMGIRWRLVELESPRVRPLSRTGGWLKEAAHAQYQIKQWRHYIKENLDSARKPIEDEGLGLVDIEPDSPALILISRRSLVSNDPIWLRRELRTDSGIHMHTYDWLLERAAKGDMAEPW